MRRVSILSNAYRVMKLSLIPSVRVSAAGRTACFWAAVAGLGALAGCAQPVQQAGRGIERSSTEYFPEGKYGKASPRVVAGNEDVPRGGGQYLVGKPYSIAGKRYFPSERPYESQVGMASYYGGAFHGRKTANGEVFDMAAISAAHPTMPLPSYARVTNTRNGRSIIVRVNDRGPYHGGRVMDVSQRVAEALDFKRQGTAQVRVDYVSRASLGGSDDKKLMATLRTDGAPAALDGAPSSDAFMTARNEPASPPRPAPQRIALAPEPRTLDPRGNEVRALAAPAVSTTTVLASAPQAGAAFAPAPVYAQAPLTGRAPLPPSRPFDLGTIPGASVPIAAPRATAALN